MVQRQKHPKEAGKHDERPTRSKSPKILCRGQEKRWRDLWEKDPSWTSWFPPRHRKIPK